MSALAEQLLDVMTTAAGVSGLSYAEPPVLLAGGFVNENYGFRLSGSPPWSGPLVVRLFPDTVEAEQPRREVIAQTTLAEARYPAPRVVFFDDDARLAGRRFFVMERLAGTALMRGLGARDIVQNLRTLRRLPETTAEVHASLHRVDPSPLLTELGEHAAGIERFFTRIDEAADAGAPGLRPGLEWLVANHPDSSQRAICHGDLWGGNILMRDGRVSGVLDWTTVTVAEPALEVGCTTMALSLAPIEAPRFVQQAVARAGRRTGERYVRAYKKLSGADLTTQPYYEALRCLSELTFVCAHRVGNGGDRPRPTWDTIADKDMVDYFKARTGVTLTLPPA